MSGPTVLWSTGRNRAKWTTFLNRFNEKCRMVHTMSQWLIFYISRRFELETDLGFRSQTTGQAGWRAKQAHQGLISNSDKS